MEKKIQIQRLVWIGVQCVVSEDGCRGFASQSLHGAFKLFGITGLHRDKAIRNNTDGAEKASRWLWMTTRVT